ncbi:MAG: WYL domain-containing protein [Sphingobacteriaceae bacterium]|nr:WYL domain-containing protein [Sphingobacteriaceae bacterium]
MEKYFRWTKIIEILEASHKTKNELLARLKEEGHKHNERTLQRDIKEMGEDVGVHIRFNRTTSFYFIKEIDNDALYQKKIENLQFAQALNALDKNKDLLYFDKQWSVNGVKNLKPVIEACKNKKKLVFDYQSFGMDESEKREGLPMFLKQFAGMWYVYLVMANDKHLRVPLDRMKNISAIATDEKWPKIKHDDVYQDIYGIMIEDKPSSTIKLKVGNYQCNYLKNIPLHPSQEIEEYDNDHKLVTLNIKPSYEFKQKIFSLLDTVEVLEPKEYREEIKQLLKTTLNKYT